MNAAALQLGISDIPSVPRFEPAISADDARERLNAALEQ